MLSGDNGILQRATDAKVKTEKAQIIEKAQTDILGQQVENKGTNITKGQLAKILNTYFKPTAETSIPDEVSFEVGHDIELITIDEKYKINLSQIYTGSFEVEQAKWTYNHDAQTVTNGTLTLNIGDYINDTETNVEGFDGKWRVLGEENGQLLLVTATCWAPYEGSTGSYHSIEFEGIDGWNNGIKKLNDIGKSYENTKLENGRSIKIEDVNKITGYNPNNTGINDFEQTGTGTPYGNGKIYQYNNKVTYSTNGSSGLWYKGDKAETTSKRGSIENKFKPLGSNEFITGDYIIDSSNFYQYYATTLTETYDNTSSIGLSNNSEAWDMLFKVQGPPYWLASKGIKTETSWVTWGLFSVTYGGLNEIVALWTSYSGSLTTAGFSIRPVVSLKSNISPNFVSKDDTTNISTYEI